MALPPHFQNMKDLEVMVRFIEEHPKVARQLKSIDFKAKRIYFDKEGSVDFGRERIKREPGWVGPAAPLQFIKASGELE